MHLFLVFGVSEVSCCFVFVVFGHCYSALYPDNFYRLVQEVEGDLKDLSFESFSMFYHNCIFTPDVSWRNAVMSRSYIHKILL